MRLNFLSGLCHVHPEPRFSHLPSMSSIVLDVVELNRYESPTTLSNSQFIAKHLNFYSSLIQNLVNMHWRNRIFLQPISFGKHNWRLCGVFCWWVPPHVVFYSLRKCSLYLHYDIHVHLFSHIHTWSTFFTLGLWTMVFYISKNHFYAFSVLTKSKRIDIFHLLPT